MNPRLKLALELLPTIALLVGFAMSWGEQRARTAVLEKAVDNLSASQWQLMELEVNRK